MRENNNFISDFECIAEKDNCDGICDVCECYGICDFCIHELNEEYACILCMHNPLEKWKEELE